MQQLSLSARPRTLDGLLGQDKLVAAIRGHIKTGRFPKAWFFYGPKGTGKTTTSKIIALAYQCEHQKIFGRPCKECRRTRSNFPIVEIPGADISTVEKMRAALSGAMSGVMGIGKYRVYIINEVQRSSTASISLFLDLLEETPDSTIFIFTTTESWKIPDAVRSRCQCYEFKELDASGIEQLVVRLLARVESDLPADRLVEALMDKQVRSPRLVAMAIEKYVAGCAPEDAADVAGAPSIDIMSLSRAITHGHWEDAARYLQNAQGGDARTLRVLLMKYLRSQLLETPEMGPRGDAVAKAITLMSAVANAEDEVVFASICASAYSLTKIFASYTV